MYIDIVPNRGSPPAVLLREGWRQGGKIQKRTVANLSGWPSQQIDALRLLLKGLDIRVRPIFHRVEDRVRAHIFLCMLAYYVEWHLRRAWVPLLFDDETLARDRRQRDPVRPAEASVSAQCKKHTRQTAEGLEVQSFPTLLANLATLCRNTCSVRGLVDGADEGRGESTPACRQGRFDCLTKPTPLQAKALALVNVLPDGAQ